jgi:hypothetical protein
LITSAIPYLVGTWIRRFNSCFCLALPLLKSGGARTKHLHIIV